MVRCTEAPKFLSIADKSPAPDKLEDKVEVGFVKHNDAEFFNHRFTWCFFQNRVNALTPAFRGEAVLQRESCHLGVNLCDRSSVVRVVFWETCCDGGRFVVPVMPARCRRGAFPHFCPAGDDVVCRDVCRDEPAPVAGEIFFLQGDQP